MTERTFASWVEPVARLLTADHAEVVAFARSLPADAWDRPLGDGDWTCKHLLAHLAGGNDQLFQILLRRVIAREPLEASLLDVDTDGENARRIDERVGWPVERLIDELVSEGEQSQDLPRSSRRMTETTAAAASR